MILQLIIIIVIISGCDKEDRDKTIKIGFYKKSQGINYQCGNDKGVTGENGQFTYEVGSSCKFNIGNMLLENINPQELDNLALKSSDEKVNIFKFLKSIDSDKNISNGIFVNKEIKLKIKNLILQNKLIVKELTYKDIYKEVVREIEESNKIKKTLSNKIFYLQVIDEHDETQIVKVSIDENITKWKTNLESDYSKVSVSNIKLIGNKLYIFRDNKAEEIWDISIDNNKYISLSYNDNYINLYLNKKEIEDNILSVELLKFILPDVYFSKIYENKNNETIKSYNFYKYEFQENYNFLYQKFNFNKESQFKEENDKDNYRHTFINNKWVEHEDNQNINFTISQNNRVVNINNDYFLSKNKVIDLSKKKVTIFENHSILMPKDSKKIQIDKIYNRDILRVKEEYNLFNSLNQIVEYQCGENYFKDISKYNNQGIKGISFSCNQYNQVSGSLVGVTEDMRIIKNIGTWEIQEIGRNPEEIIFINIDKQFYNHHKHPIFSVIKNNIWIGEFIEKDSKENILLYNDIAFNKIKDYIETNL